MANPGELVVTVAEALGLPTATVTNYDRLLLGAGLRSRHGRGRGAPKVTPMDAAHLLTAVLGSAQVKDAVETVRRYRKARSTETGEQAGLFGKLGIKELSEITAESSYLEALGALITAAASGSLLAAVWKAKEPPPPLRVIAPLIEVSARSPGTLGEIRVAALHNRRTAHVLYALPAAELTETTKALEAANAAEKAAGVRRDAGPDLTQQRQITAHTIVQIATLFAPELQRVR